ncbi:Bifunctional NAD(P)H-hydrate repair enzyme Nnr [Pirellula sp. SH-Sr6A]|uniref:NAD(P)H-hydrate dehydratase n=1 Tax=Pirellula sp. SH-Sr6A TaxID=1632865 RepID=UPI00078B54AE|nr:NAD(P)H-hydrate dehydratase [Pirellula sp. SH-Sr6A]AMV32276.1 Bifunctional NAD(P)H-hydrate repair enzyme Nnr [Pirellula sp. SH-Sr6A]
MEDASELRNLQSIPRLAPRQMDSHKGTYGHALLLGGSVGMSGALWIAGQTCLRGGAGLVTLAVPDKVQMVLSVAIPCAMTLGLRSNEESGEWWEQIRAPKYRDCVLAIGPGLGRSPESDALVWRCWLEWPHAALFDADALNTLAADRPRFADDCAIPCAPRVLTPHPGEWARLTGNQNIDAARDRRLAAQMARRLRAVVVLKGSRTWVTDGTSCFESRTGNPSLAVGGSGDALTGLITAMMCQGMKPMDAAILGVHLHGLAADLAHESLGTPSTLATDLLDFLPAAFRRLDNESPTPSSR